MTTLFRASGRGVIAIAVTALAASTLVTAQQRQTAPAPARGPVKTVTAKASLNEALAAAKKWQADAFLIQIVGNRVNPDGTLAYWDFGVYSPSAKKCALINVAGGQSQTREAGGPECAAARIVDFIDSDQAMKIARQNGLTKQDVAMNVAISPTGKQVIWMIIEEGFRNKDDVEIDIDAATGKVLGVNRRP